MIGQGPPSPFLLASAAAVLLAAAIPACLAAPPDCTHPDAWPAGMAFTHLKNAGVLDSQSLDFDKTVVTRLASEKLGKQRYRQVHRVRFVQRAGEPIEALTVSEVSDEECSMTGVDVYVVARRLGDYSVDRSPP